MNNLTTRKIILGMLITFVLALGVQSVADAITRFTRGTGDLELYAPGKDFTISFSVYLHSRVEITPSTDPKTYYYDDQAINITPSGASIRKIGSTDVNLGANTAHEMNQMGEGANRLTSRSRISVTLRAATAGIVTITISDATDNADYPIPRPPDVPDLVFTVYVAPEIDTTSTLGYVQTGGVDTPSEGDDTFFDGVAVGRGEVRIDDDFSGIDNVRVTYTVSGSGQVYVKTDDNKGRVSRSLTTSGSAPVYLDMRRSTNTVTVSIVGQRASRDKKVIYLYPPVELIKQSGDEPEQKGAVSSRLANPLVVKVEDGNNRAVSGVEINFSTTGGGSFLRDPNFPSDLYIPKIGTFAGKVMTNNSGLANVFWVLGNSGAQSATAELVGADSEVEANTVTFTATFGTTTSTASSIVIESGDGQRADTFGLLKDPLVVVVRDQRGQRVFDETVRFIARDGGTLDPPSANDPGSPDANSPISDLIEDVKTNSSGEASVRYTPPDGGGRRTVSASLQNNPTKSVIFTINGTPSRAVDRTTDTTPTVSVSRTSLSGASGDELSITVTPSTATVTGTSAFRSAGGAITGTGSSRIITLPNTPGRSYILTASASGYNNRNISVTVTGTAGEEDDEEEDEEPETRLGTLTLSKEGNQIGTSQGFIVRATPAPSSDVAFRITGGTLPYNGTILTSGIGRAVVSVPTTGSYILTAEATGYNSVQERFTAQTTTPTTTVPPTTRAPTGTPGEPSRIQVSGLLTHSGTANTPLDLPLAVRVLDANGAGVPNARVTFRVISGQGRLSQVGNGRAIRAETDRTGYARAPYTPMSASSTVRANTPGVTQTVTFTISTGSAPPTHDDNENHH